MLSVLNLSAKLLMTKPEIKFEMLEVKNTEYILEKLPKEQKFKITKSIWDLRFSQRSL